MARHFGQYLKILNISFAQWSRRSAGSAEAALSDCAVILILISDAALEPFYDANAAWLGQEGRVVVHFSGAHVSQHMMGLHPLMTFASTLYDLAVYERIAFIGEEGSLSFSQIFPELKNPSYQIPKNDKALYHAHCVMAGNFTTLLWQKFFAELETRWNIPSTVAQIYLDQIVVNLKGSAATALTGPLQRRDLDTIAKNQKALADDTYLKIYNAFVETHL
jgi:predicted short-subunit dehydrogenase-like oxidoreductase (DUF2520 family)